MPVEMSLSNRDWTEDFVYENGNYSNCCVYCHQYFLGHKRRFVCRACSASFAIACIENSSSVKVKLKDGSILSYEIIDGKRIYYQDDIVIKYWSYNPEELTLVIIK